MMLADGLIMQTQESKKLVLDALRELYMEHSCVFHSKDGKMHCSCFHFRGHCPHSWAIRVLLGLENFSSEPLPRATKAPLTWSDGPSVEDARKKRHLDRVRNERGPHMSRLQSLRPRHPVESVFQGDALRKCSPSCEVPFWKVLVSASSVAP